MTNLISAILNNRASAEAIYLVMNIQSAIHKLGLILLLLGISMNVTADQVWIDVRTPEEYAAGHLSEALLIPHEQMAELISAKVSDKNTDIHLYCRSGRRADVARDVLLQMGYNRVTNHGSLENAIVVAEQGKSSLGL